MVLTIQLTYMQDTLVQVTSTEALKLLGCLGNSFEKKLLLEICANKNVLFFCLQNGNDPSPRMFQVEGHIPELSSRLPATRDGSPNSPSPPSPAFSLSNSFTGVALPPDLRLSYDLIYSEWRHQHVLLLPDSLYKCKSVFFFFFF